MVARRGCNERYVIQRAINLVGRSKDEGDAATGLTDQLQEVQRPSRIDGEIVARISEARLGQPDGISRSRMAEMLEVDKAGPKVRC
jgi:hypothetical protein